MNVYPTFERGIIFQPNEAHVLEKSTVLQGESELWLSENAKRITASKFGKVLFRQQQKPEAMLRNIFCNKSLPNEYFTWERK